MAIELITGHAGEAHISSADDGAYNAGTDGGGRYILQTANQLQASMPDANTVTIATGDALFDGRHVRLTAPESISIDSGTQGMQRNDIVGIAYSAAGGIETAALAVVKGTPATTAVDPALPSGNILEGAASAFMPLYRIQLSGVSIGNPVRLAAVLPLLSDTASAAALTQAQAALTSSIAANTANITTNRNNITTNRNNITTANNNIASHNTRLNALERNGAYTHYIIDILGETPIQMVLRRRGNMVTCTVDGAFTPNSANAALDCGTIPQMYRPANVVSVMGNGISGNSFNITTPYRWRIATNGAVTFTAGQKLLMEFPLAITWYTTQS